MKESSLESMAMNAIMNIEVPSVVEQPVRRHFN